MERIKEMEQLLKEQKKPVPDPKRVAACKERMMEEISHQVYLCIQDQKALEAAILMIDGTKFEANTNKMTFFWGAWVKRYRPRHWQKAM